MTRGGNFRARREVHVLLCSSVMRRMRLGVPLLVSLSVLACGGGKIDPSAVPDAGDDAGYGLMYAQVPASDPDASTRKDRLTPHQFEIVPSMALQVVYIGTPGKDAAENQDAFVEWLLSSGYWGRLEEYGVHAGKTLPSVTLATSDVFLPGMVNRSLIPLADLESRLHALLHVPPDDAGADAAPSIVSPIPKADAYIFFLPDGINVSLGVRGSYEYQTCIDAGGYHAFDGDEPYAVMPPCTLGHSARAISHELAELATDAKPTRGWFSEEDLSRGGGEVADVCNHEVTAPVEGWLVTQLWSNREGACLPR